MLQKAKETLRQENMERQKELDLKQALELEIKCLTGAMQVKTHGRGPRCEEKIRRDPESLNEKKELEALEDLNQALVVKEQLENVELKDARKELINLCSIWENHLNDPNWHPFKDVTSENGSKYEIIDDSDERLNELKHEFGEAAYELVTTALMEMDEGPSSSRCITTELWNYRQGRTATLNEGITYALQKLKASKAKKR